MNCEDLRESFDLYSLGLLEEGSEKSEIRAHLARGCSACDASMKEALAIQALVLSQAPLVEPPARLKRRVLGAVGVQSMGWTWFAAVCAAAMLMLALWMNIMVRQRGQELAETRIALAQSNSEREKLQAVFQFLQEPETQKVRFGDPTAPRGNVYLHPRLGVMLIATNLPPIDANQTYEMWLIPKGQGAAPQPAGIFQPSSQQQNQGNSAFHILPQIVNAADLAAVAVSIEPAGGSQMPTRVVFGAPIV
jgi:anti-sigma-K factor RskA